MQNEIKMDIEFFEHLLKCLENQKNLHNQPWDVAEEKQEIIDEALKKGQTLLDPVLKKNNLSKYALNKFFQKWEKDVSLIQKDINSDLNKKEKFIKWGFVRQECEMYCVIGEPIDPKEFQDLCKRRGFDDNMKKYIVETMKYTGLGDKF